MSTLDKWMAGAGLCALVAGAPTLFVVGAEVAYLSLTCLLGDWDA